MKLLYCVFAFMLTSNYSHAQQKLIYRHMGIEDKPINTVQLIVGNNPSDELVNVATNARDGFILGIRSTIAPISKHTFYQLVFSILTDSATQYNAFDNWKYGNIMITIIDKSLQLDIYIPSTHSAYVLGCHLNYLIDNHKAYKKLRELFERINIPLERQPRSEDNLHLFINTS